MNQQLINCLLLGAAFLALFGIAELLYHKARVQAEYTRKLVHFGTGVLTLLFPVFLQSHWYVLLLCGSFAVLLTLSQKFNFLKSVNAIDRKSHGSISYPVAVYGTFLFYTYGYTDDWSNRSEPQMPFYYIPILTLAICDPLAALLGKRFPWKPYKVGAGKKTLTGSLAFFTSATLLCFIILYAATGGFSVTNAISIALLTGIATTIAEACSRNGFDNLTIPGTAILTLYIISFTSLYHNIHR